ncbi:hypothetical protein L916_04681 [Phytophthora nicotianae]|uniref:DDE-1 domain-containing protein n=1 Tax=Phytophthora nicotianae TaxID=4792 RepID=W2JFL2_PHYNI|nr:hypothetical protein L916_04681 [Phytophthora nicotianae]
MDVAVMKVFKDRVRSLYLYHHIENGFPSSPTDKRARISRIVAEAWNSIPQEVIVRSFVKTDIIPVVPRNVSGCFRVPAPKLRLYAMKSR